MLNNTKLLQEVRSQLKKCRELYVDLAVEKSAIAAQKNNRKIAVQIKSFLKPSPIQDLEEAVGQYQVY